jgi:hypothetical protein
MSTSNNFSSVSVLVTYQKDNNTVTKEIVPFRVYQEGHRYKAIPLIAAEQRKFSQLPSELLFELGNKGIICPANTDESNKSVIMDIVQELRIQDDQY